jgi:hypothetical protein
MEVRTLKNKYRFEGNDLFIECCNGKEFVTSKEMFDKANSYAGTWHINKRGYVEGNVIPTTKPRRKIKFHRFINNPLPHEKVDHKDGDKLNNRPDNLNNGTQAQNAQNRANMNKNNTTGLTGLIWFKPRKCWKAQKMVNGKVYTKNSKDKQVCIDFLKNFKIH